MPELFKDWIEETRTLQEDAYRIDYDHFAAGRNAPPDKITNLVDYIAWNVMAAMHELVELQSETSWKPWQMDAPYVNRDQVRGEAVDVLHFIANILAALGVDDDELNEEYLRKMAINKDRQLRASGYHVLEPGVKCRVCKRALDDVKSSINDKTVCVDCHIHEIIHA